MSTDLVPILDPNGNSSSGVVHPVRDPDAVDALRALPTLAVLGIRADLGQPDAETWPDDDEKGRGSFSARIASGLNPDFCKSKAHPSAKAVPLEGEPRRHLSVYEPKKGQWKLVRTGSRRIISPSASTTTIRCG